MKILLYLFFFSLTLVLINCSKDDVDPQPSVPKDTLATGWTKSHLADSADLLDIYFFGNTGYTISGSRIYKSLDAGNTWQNQNHPLPSPSFVNMSMGSSDNAIFVSYSFGVVNTKDGGATYDTAELQDSWLSDVFFINSLTAYVVGQHFWKTTDGGTNWIKLYSFSSGPGYKSMFFLDEQTGWILGPNGLMSTANGGLNWQAVPIPVYDFSVNSVWFTNPGTGYISAVGKIARSPNGGSSWENVYQGNSFFHDMHFVDENTFYITDLNRIFKTTNRGNTWTREVVTEKYSFVELHFTSATRGWACGSKGTILKFAP